MKNNLAQRVEKILMQDKMQRPQTLLPALRSDIRDILREYAELSQDINIEIEENESGYDIIILAKAIRFRA